MKKIRTILSVAVLALSASLTGCSSDPHDTAIKEYSKICDEFVEAVKAGDTEKVQTLADEADKIQEQLQKLDLTEEQQQQVKDITVKAAAAMFGEAWAE